MAATCGAGVTAAAGTRLAHHLFAKVFTFGKSLCDKSRKHVEFPPHAFAHWEVFAPAALRGARASISVPFSGRPLSRPLRIFGLVGRYLTNYLIRRHLILECCLCRINHSRIYPLSGLILSFPRLSQARGQINDVLLSITPVLLPDLHG